MSVLTFSKPATPLWSVLPHQRRQKRETEEGERGRRGMSGCEVVERALRCLGRGFDVTSDFRAKYVKGKKRLLLLNEVETRELAVPGFGSVHGVSVDIKCDKGERMRYQSDVLEFSQMSELFNRRGSLAGKIPSGAFNSMFQFNGGVWARDAAQTKCLALDGYFISLFNLRIDRWSLSLADHVADAVPSSWEPAALARFIENYGTHIIVGLSVGGQDVVFVRQDQSSTLPPAEIKNHLDKLGDQLFTGTCTLPPLHWKTKDHRQKVHEAFNVFDTKSVLPGDFTSVSSKSGITVICSKRGGDAYASSHCEWLPTVSTTPDVINFTFVPITSLLKDVPGKGFLSHAINLYLRYKPPISDLEYFLDFQSHKQWAPMLNDHPLGPSSNRFLQKPALQFNLMGPKLYVNTAQVVVGRRPVTGMRLHLEGKKNDRLAVHLQHLSNPPAAFFGDPAEDSRVQLWRGSEEATDERYYEPVQWKKFSHVCTAAVKYDPLWRPSAGAGSSAFVVAGAQLHVKTHRSRRVLHLRLLYSEVPSCGVGRSAWEQSSPRLSQRLGLFSTASTMISGGGVVEREKPAVVVDSGVFPTGPPVPVQAQKLLRFVDTSELCKGPQDCPGYWLVTGAKLAMHKGKICLHVKFSLLTPPCEHQVN
uniref:MACPF domain-containing protein At1g14780 n=1 Tax=Anthurium amnicola TaxID=1678845 RepID=A0A1D1ZFT3_9ARAE